MTLRDLLMWYLAAINAVTLFVFIGDKLIAIRNGSSGTRRQSRRVPEAKLLGLCAAGGAAGGLVGMLVARHKIRKPRFFVGVPTLLLLWVALLAGLRWLGLV